MSTPRGIGRKLGWLPIIAALGWVTDCSATHRDFSKSAGAGDADAGTAGGNAVGGDTASGGSGTAGQTSSGAGRPGHSGGGPDAGSAGEGGMSASTQAGAAGVGLGGGPGGSGGGGGPGGSGGGTPLPDGTACQADPNCANKHCVDGVCCNTACTGCNACSNTLTGQDNGKCAPVLTGQDPHSACADETASNQCGNDGTCDGKGACAKVGSSHVCKAAGCSADGKSFVAASTCNRDGGGTCATVTAQDCGGFPCTATGCAKPCTTNSDCGTTNYCQASSGKCVARKSDGAAATNTYECSSGFVADGVCCDSACTGQCQSCKQTPGVCKSVTTPRTSCGGSGVCGTLKCDGTHPGCVAPGNEVSCASSCSSDLTSKLSATCNGSGSCGTATATSCNAQYCSGGACVPKLANDTGGCAKNTVCLSGNCATSTSGGTMCCAAGSSNCSQGCFDLATAVNHCGSCTTSCDPNQVCSSRSCQCAHGTPFSCQLCPSWNFESNTTEGFISDPNPIVPAQAVSLKVLPTPAGATFSGSHSLAFTANLVDTDAGVVVPFCDASSPQDVTGLSYYLYFDGPPYFISKYDNAAAGEYVNFIDIFDYGSSIPAKKWIYISKTFYAPQSATQLSFLFAPNTAWSGTIYIDEVQVTN